ncbi:hypothetical protein DYU05_09595 [Mucilaginibacter terrenus]|uniref:Uncharacterized protein n=1 Tax=Mucilaginibacter terrenus TaxID=2482727 RepID=A0A3E2NXS9_9SPHI|nr:hypothetical protein [Mucilaginibacter terrenus]RFZ85825.1 hypothetical protein DYU05_09595 [Mucilaginibacter terrenus]
MRKARKIVLILGITALLCSFKAFNAEQDWITWANHALSESVDPLAEARVKKWEIMLTADHFMRLRKTYQQGKQEYYSFNMQRFAEMDYVPGAVNDTLRFHTRADDIIYQTYNDPKGDIDSMATMLVMPVRKLSAGRLDSLKQALEVLKGKNL